MKAIPFLLVILVCLVQLSNNFLSSTGVATILLNDSGTAISYLGLSSFDNSQFVEIVGRDIPL